MVPQGGQSQLGGKQGPAARLTCSQVPRGLKQHPQGQPHSLGLALFTHEAISPAQTSVGRACTWQALA